MGLTDCVRRFEGRVEKPRIFRHHEPLAYVARLARYLVAQNAHCGTSGYFLAVALNVATLLVGSVASSCAAESLRILFRGGQGLGDPSRS